MAQTIVMQEQALQNAQARIADLRTNWPAARPVVASCLACLAG